jgi:hypothetical protein
MGTVAQKNSPNLTRAARFVYPPYISLDCVFIETVLGLAASMRSRTDYTVAIQILRHGLDVEAYLKALQLLQNDLGIQPEPAT